MTKQTLRTALWVLFATQLLHVAAAFTIDARDYDGGVIGLPAGLLGLTGNLLALWGLQRAASWAPRLAAVTGFGIAFGFVLYHATPVEGWATSPYFGDTMDVGPLAWASVILAIAAGLWTGVVALRADREATVAA